MIQIENTYFELGKSSKRNCLIICDRGVMDASAYIETDKWEEMKKSNGWNEIEMRDNRYNQIVHMVSAANGAEEFYSTEVRRLKFSNSFNLISFGFICRNIRVDQKASSLLVI